MMVSHRFVALWDPVKWGWDKMAGWIDDGVRDAVKGLLATISTMLLTAVGWFANLIAEMLVGGGATASGLGSGWYSSIFSNMQAVGFYLGYIFFAVGVAGYVIGGHNERFIKHVVLQAPKWGIVTGGFLGLVMLVDSVILETSRWLLSSSVGGNAGTFFGSFAALASGVTTSEGALTDIGVMITAGLMLVFSVFIVIVNFVLRAAVELIVLGGPLMASFVLTKRPEMFTRYAMKVLAVLLAKFVMFCAVMLGAAGAIAAAGGNVGSTLPPPPPELNTAADVDQQLEADARQDAAEEAGAGQLIVQMLVGLATMLMGLVAPAAILSLFEVTSDGAAVASAGLPMAAAMTATAVAVGVARSGAAGGAGGGGSSSGAAPQGSPSTRAPIGAPGGAGGSRR